MEIHYATLLLLLVPLIGAVLVAAMPSAKAAMWWAFLVSVATLAIAGWMAAEFDWSQELAAGSAAQQIEQSVQLRVLPGVVSLFRIKSINASFSLGVDAISFWLVAMTVLLMPVSLLASFTYIKERIKEFYGWMLALLFAMLGVFVARDLLLFYIFFELTLIPMFFIIGIWGGPERRWAANKFFLMTFSASILTLATVIFLGVMAGSFDLTDVTIYAQSLSTTAKFWVFLGLLAGFAVKVPLFPVHTWLPLAHTEAPTAGSVILAGVLLKLGTYGILRLAIPMGIIGPEGVAMQGFLYLLGIIGVIGIIYGALAAWVQPDIKKLVAYSSVSHLGFCILGMAAFNDIGMQGSVLYMINHGLSTGAMFLVIGMIYERYHTRSIHDLSGLARKMPIMAFFFVFFTLSSIALPGLNGFVSEFLTLLGAYSSEHLGIIVGGTSYPGIIFGTLGALGVILSSMYMLHMVARIIFGPLKTPEHEDVPGLFSGQRQLAPADDGGVRKNDINGREVALLIPLAVAIVLLGLMPTPVLRSILGPIQLLRQPSQTQMVASTPSSGEPAAVASAPAHTQISLAQYAE